MRATARLEPPRAALPATRLRAEPRGGDLRPALDAGEAMAIRRVQGRGHRLADHRQARDPQREDRGVPPQGRHLLAIRRHGPARGARRAADSRSRHRDEEPPRQQVAQDPRCRRHGVQRGGRYAGLRSRRVPHPVHRAIPDLASRSLRELAGRPGGARPRCEQPPRPALPQGARGTRRRWRGVADDDSRGPSHLGRLACKHIRRGPGPASELRLRGADNLP